MQRPAPIESVPPASTDFARVSQPAPSPPREAWQDEPSRGWGGRILLALVLIAVIGSAAGLIAYSGRPEDTGPKLTHTIGRGDLIVSVIEQGTLESSNNTEIKCRVRGYSMVTWVIDGGEIVKEGDELVRLDTKSIEEAVSTQKTETHMANATLEESKSAARQAEIAIDAYVNGRFKSQLQTLANALIIAESNYLSAVKMLDQSEKLHLRGYVTDLEVEANKFTVTQAQLERNVKRTQIQVLNKFTRAMQMETLNGNVLASNSKLQADRAGLKMDETRLARTEEELRDCVVKAPRGGMVIYPSAAAWKDSPDIDAGANVRKDQTLLLMPDLTKMQVKVGIHESVVDRVKVGLRARVMLPDRELTAKVSAVATVTKPAGWWTGNVVKYDTIIELPEESGLKPGMSAEVEVIVAEHKDVLTIPVGAIVDTDSGAYCWVKTVAGTKRRLLKLGDSNDVFVLVKDGVIEGDEVVLNPLAHITEAQQEALKTLDAAQREKEKEESTATDALDSARSNEVQDGN
jgi:HlyD family secretion protein